LALLFGVWYFISPKTLKLALKHNKDEDQLKIKISFLILATLFCFYLAFTFK